MSSWKLQYTIYQLSLTKSVNDFFAISNLWSNCYVNEDICLCIWSSIHIIINISIHACYHVNSTVNCIAAEPLSASQMCSVSLKMWTVEYNRSSSWTMTFTFLCLSIWLMTPFVYICSLLMIQSAHRRFILCFKDMFQKDKAQKENFLRSNTEMLLNLASVRPIRAKNMGRRLYNWPQSYTVYVCECVWVGKLCLEMEDYFIRYE